MSPTDLRLIQKSFPLVFAQKSSFGKVFYARLFEVDPSLRAMFKTSMARQSEMLMQALSMIVRGLSTDGQLPPKARDMAVRHASYGVTDAHYAQMGEALIWSLSETLGPAFDTEMRGAWERAYAHLKTTMMAAAADTADAQSEQETHVG